MYPGKCTMLAYNEPVNLCACKLMLTCDKVSRLILSFLTLLNRLKRLYTVKVKCPISEHALIPNNTDN